MAHLISFDSFDLTPASLPPFPPFSSFPPFPPSGGPSAARLGTPITPARSKWSDRIGTEGPGKSKDNAEMIPVRDAVADAIDVIDAAGALGRQLRTKVICLVVDVLPITVFGSKLERLEPTWPWMGQGCLSQMCQHVFQAWFFQECHVGFQMFEIWIGHAKIEPFHVPTSRTQTLAPHGLVTALLWLLAIPF